MSDPALRSPALTCHLLRCCIVIGCVLPTGCKLVDQRSFDHAAGRAPVPKLPPAPTQVAHAAPTPPLFVVPAGRPDQDWQPDLRQAVAEALARKPNVLFTVESVAPAPPPSSSSSSSSPAAQAASMRAAATLDGLPVAQAITADGAQPAQVEMTALADPAARAPEVRVYVH